MGVTKANSVPMADIVAKCSRGLAARLLAIAESPLVIAAPEGGNRVPMSAFT